MQAARAGWSEMMTAAEAVKRYGDQLVGEYVVVQVWSIDHSLDNMPIETQSAWVEGQQRLHVLNVPEDG